MSSLHTIVEPTRPPLPQQPQAPHFIIKPSFPPSSTEFTNFKPGSIHEAEEEDVDILDDDDEDEDDLEDEEDDLEDAFPGYHLARPGASNNNQTSNVTPQIQQTNNNNNNNYLSINHIISPNTSHLSSHPYPQKKETPQQTSTPITSINELQPNTTTQQQGKTRKKRNLPYSLVYFTVFVA